MYTHVCICMYDNKGEGMAAIGEGHERTSFKKRWFFQNIFEIDYPLARMLKDKKKSTNK